MKFVFLFVSLFSLNSFAGDQPDRVEDAQGIVWTSDTSGYYQANIDGMQFASKTGLLLCFDATNLKWVTIWNARVERNYAPSPAWSQSGYGNYFLRINGRIYTYRNGRYSLSYGTKYPESDPTESPYGEGLPSSTGHEPNYHSLGNGNYESGNSYGTGYNGSGNSGYSGHGSDYNFNRNNRAYGLRQSDWTSGYNNYQLNGIGKNINQANPAPAVTPAAAPAAPAAVAPITVAPTPAPAPPVNKNTPGNFQGPYTVNGAYIGNHGFNANYGYSAHGSFENNNFNNFNGDKGFNGTNGFNGNNGFNGTNGFNGNNGFNGTNGFQGNGGFIHGNSFNRPSTFVPSTDSSLPALPKL